MKHAHAHEGDLTGTLAEAMRLLSRGVADRRHGFHTPTLATLGLDGAPEARTVVLRAFDAATRCLRFHTDARSGKVAELTAEPRASLHFYDAAAQVQIRARGRISLHAEDELADSAWANSREMSRMCYAITPGPGTPIAAPPAAPRDSVAGRGVFRAALLHVTRLEWLWLAAGGHQRALFAWDEAGTPSATWLVP